MPNTVLFTVNTGNVTFIYESLYAWPQVYHLPCGIGYAEGMPGVAAPLFFFFFFFFGTLQSKQDCLKRMQPTPVLSPVAMCLWPACLPWTSSL